MRGSFNRFQNRFKLKVEQKDVECFIWDACYQPRLANVPDYGVRVPGSGTQCYLPTLLETFCEKGSGLAMLHSVINLRNQQVMKGASDGIHSGLEPQRRNHLKSKIEFSQTPQKNCCDHTADSLACNTTHSFSVTRPYIIASFSSGAGSSSFDRSTSLTHVDTVDGQVPVGKRLRRKKFFKFLKNWIF